MEGCHTKLEPANRQAHLHDWLSKSRSSKLSMMQSWGPQQSVIPVGSESPKCPNCTQQSVVLRAVGLQHSGWIGTNYQSANGHLLPLLMAIRDPLLPGAIWNRKRFLYESYSNRTFCAPEIVTTAPSLQQREIEKSQARPMNGSLHPPNYPKNPAKSDQGTCIANCWKNRDKKKNGWYQVHGGLGNKT